MKFAVLAGATAIVATAAILSNTVPQAAETCHSDNALDDLERAEIETLYDCAIDGLVAGWQAAEHPVAMEYKEWAAASSYAAAVGAHANRLLYTYVNDVGAEQYLAFAEEGVEMPVGTVIAKESFNLHTKGDNKGNVRAGPLFLMEKVAAGTFDETANWKYTLITPKGKAWLESGVTDPEKVAQFCHDCHSATEDFQDALYYPAFDARVEEVSN